MSKRHEYTVFHTGECQQRVKEELTSLGLHVVGEGEEQLVADDAPRPGAGYDDLHKYIRKEEVLAALAPYTQCITRVQYRRESDTTPVTYVYTYEPDEDGFEEVDSEEVDDYRY